MSPYTRHSQHIASLDRYGRFHVFQRGDGQRVTEEPMEIWEAMIAAALGVHPCTISRDVAQFMPPAEPCPTCGMLRARLWLDDE